MAKRQERFFAASIVVGAILCGLVSSAGASEIDTPYIDGSMRKLGRGVANVVTAPGEIVRMVEIIGQRDGYLAGISAGLFQGFWRTLLRAGAGVYEVVSFPIELPKNFQPILYPEFVFAHGSWGQQDR